MKKNITINLFGTLYAIDDDAYQLLERYMDGMKSYFNRQDGGDEIVDDIEHRIAELFWELKEQGCEAITIEHVKDIIQKIGNPEQLSSEAKAEDGEANTKRQATFQDEEEDATGTLLNKWLKSLKSRRMYRNTQDKLLGGVLSGLTKYLGGSDPLPARLIFVLLVIFTNVDFFPIFWLWVISYLTFWVIMPEAKTPEDRLRMEGHKVTPENLQAQILKEENEKQEAPAAPRQSTAGGCLSTLLRFCLFCFLGFWAFIFFIILISLLIAAVCIGFGFFGAANDSFMGMEVTQFLKDNPSMVTIGIVCGIIALIIPIYALLRVIFSSSRMSGRQIVTLLIIWIVAFSLGIGSVVNLSTNWQENSYKYNELGENANTSLISQPYDYQDFNRLEVSNAFEVYYTQADSFGVSVEAPTGLIAQINIEKSGNTLSCRNYNNKRHPKAKIFICAPELNYINVSGACKFQANDSLKMKNLELEFSGASKFDISHVEAEQVNVTCSGASKGEMSMSGGELKIANSGASKLDLTVNCNLVKLDNSGASKVNVSGKTQREEIENTGAGKINSVNLEVADKAHSWRH